IRLDMERAYARSGVQTIVLRAGNFVDPNRQGCIMSAMYLREIQRGKIMLPGPADTRQAMCYLPDWARAAVALAEQRDSLAPFEDVPFAGHTWTGQDIKSAAERALNRSVTFRQFPWGLLWLASPFWEMARELGEMRYLWRTDHALSSTRLTQLVPTFKPTPTDEVFQRMLA
ncbi:MAG: epimerase, partial [Primorskyibacter sp.]